MSGILFEPAYHLRGMENLMIDMAMEAEEADVLLDKLCEFSTKVAVRAAEMGADWIWLGDDMGTQISMLMSPEMWTRYFKHRMKHIIDEVRKVKPDMIIAYHSCGSIMPIIQSLIEIGVNVLNPIQESAENMNQNDIKEKYGDKLSFICGLDTQNFLVNAEVEDIKTQMKQKAKSLSVGGGGYIVGVSHTLQHDVPPQNIKVIVEALDA